jgi:hypothetical protein
MSKIRRQMKRKGTAKKKRDERDFYRRNRELGTCFLHEKGCQNNGDLITHCTFCDFKVQACTEHSVLGRNEAKKHLMLKHPAKTLPTVIAGVLGGRSLE